ncbi:serine/threonine-protein kinase DCLK3 [Synchiropus picturatus]
MSPPLRPQYGCEASRKWRPAAPPASLGKRTGVAPQPWPLHTQPSRHNPNSLCAPPHVSRFHTRYAEESAERPHLVTVVRPCGQSSLRKVTILLNRRGVVSLEQLLLDISEALGFPRWHRSRVTRLFTTYAREVKNVCDFFRGDPAFLAFGKTRPELSNVEEALEELFPEHLQYRADVLTVWEKKLRSVQNKTSKADSGYSEGTDCSEPHCNGDMHLDKNKRQNNRISVPSTDTRISSQKGCLANNKINTEPYRYAAFLPNHLQRLRVKGEIKESKTSAGVSPSKHDSDLRDVNVASPTLCQNCITTRVKHGPEPINRLSGWVKLPPVARKQRGRSSTEQDERILDTGPAGSPAGNKETLTSALLPPLNPLPAVGEVNNNIHERLNFDLFLGDCELTQSDVESLYVFGRVVGDGNFAVVQECRRRNDGQTFAVKIVERSKLIGREHMMQNELSLLGSLSHPRIVRLFAHHRTVTHSYLVMELVSGGDLFEAISVRGTFSEAESGLMVSDVSEALNYIHCKSIVHRDIKPENLLIEHTDAGVNRLKLGDFGLAMVVTEPVFTICGTPTYVAPEILAETGYGVEVDVWALGVILYIVLCGFPPFRSRDRNQEELFQIIKQAQVHFFSPYWDPVSAEAKGLVKALLQPDPTVRLTAEKTLLHPWVKEMASICKERALKDKTRTKQDIAVKDSHIAQSHSGPGITAEDQSINGHPLNDGEKREEDNDAALGEKHTDAVVTSLHTAYDSNRPVVQESAVSDSNHLLGRLDSEPIASASLELPSTSPSVKSSQSREKQTPNSLFKNPTSNLKEESETGAVKCQNHELRAVTEPENE